MPSYNLLQLALIPVYLIYIVTIAIQMFRVRSRAVREKKVSLSYFKSYTESDIPDQLQVYKNHYSNQFEFPILFMITCAVIGTLKLGSPLVLSLSILFMGTRMAHSYIHLGRNNPIQRAQAFLMGIILLLVIWLHIIFKLYSQGF